MSRKLGLAVVVSLFLAATTLLPFPARADRTTPLRSGTIVGGTGLRTGGGQPWENPAAQRSGCEYAAECLAWLQSGCNPALAGHDPVVNASIVDVSELADGESARSLQMVAPSVPPWGLWPGAVIQLWRQDCTEIPDEKRHGIGSDAACPRYAGCRFEIPTSAKWMTISGYVTTVQLSWTLSSVTESGR
jgi:hypothetical protein